MLSLLQMDASLWPEARDALAGVAELSRLKGGEGLDIYCLNSPHYRLDLRASRLLFSLSISKLILTRVKRKSVTSLTTSFPKVVTHAICIFVTHPSTGQTPTGAKLRQILDIYVPRIEDSALNHKPISILVITDGVPSKFLDRLGEIER